MNLLLAKQTSELLKDGLLTLILGILVVFLGIALIVVSLKLFGFIFNKILNKNDVESNIIKQTPVESVSIEDESIPEDVKVAIISAVIACYYENSGKKCDFVVRKIKRLN